VEYSGDETYYFNWEWTGEYAGWVYISTDLGLCGPEAQWT
jgi:hypothetical protein